MNSVYGNATLTLATAASEDAFGGLFRRRDPSLIVPHAIYCKLDQRYNSANPGIYQSLFHAVPTRSAQLEVAYAKLNRRAWVVQERVLSARTVYFSSNQIWWECRELEANESFPLRLPDTIKSWYGRQVKSWSSEKAYSTWRTILTVYTVSDLTNPADKLVAISGLAKRFSSLLDDEYVAGLWRKRITTELLWHHESQATVRRRPSTYRAPTWSWASIDAKVSHFYMPEETIDCIEILGIKVTPVGTDKTAEIQNAIIRLRGHLIPIPTPTIQRTIFDDEGWSLYWDAKDEISYNEAFFCLPVRRLNEPVPRVADKELWGLVLQLQAGFPAIYRRVGVFTVSDGFQVSSVGQDKVHTYGKKFLSTIKSFTTGHSNQWFDESQARQELYLI